MLSRVTVNAAIRLTRHAHFMVLIVSSRFVAFFSLAPLVSSTHADPSRRGLRPPRRTLRSLHGGFWLPPAGASLPQSPDSRSTAGRARLFPEPPRPSQRLGSRAGNRRLSPATPSRPL